MQNKSKFNELGLIECRCTSNDEDETFRADKNGPEAELGMAGGIGQRPGAAGQTQVTVKRPSTPGVHVRQVGRKRREFFSSFMRESAAIQVKALRIGEQNFPFPTQRR